MKKKNSELDILKCIVKTKNELDTANINFETAESGLVDYYSYEIKASKAKLDYLINKVKEKGIHVDMINNLELGLDRINVI